MLYPIVADVYKELPNPPSAHQSLFNVNACTQPYASHCTAIEKLLYIKIQFNMKLRGHQLVILSSLAVGVLNITTSRYLMTFLPISSRFFSILWIGLMFLIYPLLGHLADVYLTRYRTLKSSYVIIIIGGSAILVYWLIDFIADLVWKFEQLHHIEDVVVPLTLFALFIIGIGLFEANAIQFGLDPTTPPVSVWISASRRWLLKRVYRLLKRVNIQYMYQARKLHSCYVHRVYPQRIDMYQIC